MSWKRTALAIVSLVAVLAMVASCAPPTPQVIEKEVVVEKPVVETVEVVKEVVVEKVVTATPVPKVATKIKAWTIGPGPMPFTRATNLEEAAIAKPEEVIVLNNQP